MNCKNCKYFDNTKPVDTAHIAEVKPNFYCGAGKRPKEYNRTIDDIVEGRGLKPLNSKED